MSNYRYEYKTIQSLAAKKAWVTRRKNETARLVAEGVLAAKRSAAAFKAWETRRRMAEKRSASARKAWVTRRKIQTEKVY